MGKSKTICPRCAELEEKLFKMTEKYTREKNKNTYLEKKAEIEKEKSEKKVIELKKRTIEEGAFGSGTPSSKIPIKPNNPLEKNKGGAKEGHEGVGRSSISREEADEITRIETICTCPECEKELEKMSTRGRSVVDIDPITIKKIIYQLERKKCPICRKVYTAKAPEVMPKFLYGNNILSYLAVEHFVNGITIGSLENRLNIGTGSILSIFNKLAEILESVPHKLEEEYRNSIVKHADETGWRYDGQNGYVYLFCTPDISLFKFKKTRAAIVPKEVFGEKTAPGVLVVDRYSGYNKLPCKIQYCYAHLLRTIQDLEKEFPDNIEIINFIETTSPLLARAMSLKRLVDNDEDDYYRMAIKTKNRIIQEMNKEANHQAIQRIQDIFRKNTERLYHWVDDINVPADNNRAERELRPLVIARKLSFGSNSVKSAKTRETMMSVLLTLRKKKKGEDLIKLFKSFLDKISENQNLDLYKTLYLDIK